MALLDTIYDFGASDEQKVDLSKQNDLDRLYSRATYNGWTLSNAKATYVAGNIDLETLEETIELILWEAINPKEKALASEGWKWANSLWPSDSNVGVTLSPLQYAQSIVVPPQIHLEVDQGLEPLETEPSQVIPSFRRKPRYDSKIGTTKSPGIPGKRGRRKLKANPEGTMDWKG